MRRNTMPVNNMTSVEELTNRQQSIPIKELTIVNPLVSGTERRIKMPDMKIDPVSLFKAKFLDLV